MQDIIENNKAALINLARRHGATRLDLFGSAATGQFDPRRSDLDFIVVFEDMPPGGMAHAYFGLLDDLQKHFGRPVDLITERSIRNPYFRQSVEETRRPIHDA